MLVFGSMNSGVSIQHGKQTSGIARGDTVKVYHLSEVSSYPDAGAQIDDALHKCVHPHPDVFGVLESTAMGDTGWFYEKYWYAKKNFVKGKSRLCALFLPWFLGTDKYPTPTWLRTRQNQFKEWRPMNETNAMCAKAKMYVASNTVLQKVLGPRWELPREQAFFWEANWLEHRDTGREKKWFQEMPTDDKESFQGSFDNAFGREIVAEVFTQREKTYSVYAIVGQSVEDKFEPQARDIDQTLPREAVRHASPKGDVYRWELIPIKWKDNWNSIEDLKDDEEQDLRLLVFHPPERGYDYAIGVDTSGGLGEDYTCIVVSRRARHKQEPDMQAAEFRSRLVSHVEAYAFVAAIAAYYGKYMEETTNFRQPYLAIEQVRAVGDTCQVQLKKLGFYRFHRMTRYDGKKLGKNKSIKDGWYTFGWSRDIITGSFKAFVENGWYKVNSPKTIWEMDHWEVHLTGAGKEKMEHSEESTDDGIFANALAAFCPNDLQSLTERTTKNLGRPAEKRDLLRREIDFSPTTSHTVSTADWGNINAPANPFVARRYVQ